MSGESRRKEKEIQRESRRKTFMNETEAVIIMCIFYKCCSIIIIIIMLDLSVF